MSFSPIPGYTFPTAPPAPISLPGYGTLNETAPTPSEQQLTMSAANAPIRFGYGRARIAPLIANALPDGAGNLLLDCVLGEGTFDALVAMEINDAAAPGVAVTFYDGSQTTIDASLAAAWLLQGVNFTDVRAGTAYAVLAIPPSLDLSIDERSISFEVRLRKIYDPRDGTQSLANPATWKWSDNPVLALADFLASPKLGPGDSVVWSSVGPAADRADEMLGGKKRFTIGITFDEQKPKKDVEEVLRGAAGCWVAREGPLTYLVADAPIADLSTTLHLQVGDWLPRTLRYSQRDGDRAPNTVSVRYTNTAIKPWAEAYTDPPLQTAEVIAGEVDELATVINATWIQDYPQAVRLRRRYFGEYTLGLKTLEFEAFEKAWKIRRGDVVRLSNGVDLVAKPVRVQRLVPMGFAKVKVYAQEYDPAMYSDEAPATPPSVNTPLQDPRTVVAPTLLTMVEEVYLDQGQGATVATGAKYLSRFRLGWVHSTDRYRLDYVVEFLDGTTLIVQGSPTSNEFISPAVEQGRLYKARVRTRNVLGFMSTPPLEATATAQGKLLAPSDVPAIISAFEIGGELLAQIQPAIDIDTLRYEWRYFPNGTGTWESATFIDLVDGLRVRFKGLPVGTHRIFVKARDSVGQQSANAKYVDVTITSDSDAFLQDREFVSPTLTRMIAFRNEVAPSKHWITNHDETWNTLFPLAMTSYPNPVATYGTGNSSFVGEAWDIGEQITGDWQLLVSVTDHAGTATYAIESSDNGSVWTSHAGLSWTGAARYVRPVISTTGTMEIVGAPKMSLAALTRKESGGPVTSNGGSAKTINLTGRYAKAVRITITPRGTTAVMPTVDNVVLSLVGTNSFDVYLFDATGLQVATDFTWDFEGF
jgi:hypothetical protein